MEFGYVVQDSDYDIQMMAMVNYGCDVKVSASIFDLVGQLNKGDSVVCWRVDKLAKTVKELQAVLDAIHQAGASVRLIQEGVDSSTDCQQLLDQIVDLALKLEND